MEDVVDAEGETAREVDLARRLQSATTAIERDRKGYEEENKRTSCENEPTFSVSPKKEVSLELEIIDAGQASPPATVVGLVPVARTAHGLKQMSLVRANGDQAIPPRLGRGASGRGLSGKVGG